MPYWRERNVKSWVSSKKKQDGIEIPQLQKQWQQKVSEGKLFAITRDFTLSAAWVPTDVKNH